MHPKTYYRDKEIIRYQLALKKFTRFLQKYFCPLLIAVAVVSFIFFDVNNWNTLYFDTDGYMRAIRLHNWLLNPSFFEQVITQSNYPFGEINHWTRPMDIWWLINMLPFLGMDNLKDAVFMGGVFMSPWLHIFSILALYYGLHRNFNIFLTIFGCFIFIADPLMQLYYAIGRPDHHALMALLGIYSLSLILCWLKKRHLRYLRWLGFSLALMTFTAIEGVIIYGLILCFYLYLYIYKNNSLQPTVKISKYFMLSITLFWLLNPPYQGYFYADNGRLSVLYVVFSALLFFILYGLNLCHLHTRALKIWSLICAGLGGGIVLLLIFGPEIFTVPLDTQIQTIWSTNISEMSSFTDLTLSKKIAVYPFAFASLVIAVFLSPQKKYKKIMHLTLILGIPLFILNLWAVRFSNYQFFYNIIPWLCLIDYLYKKATGGKKISPELPNIIPSMCLAILLFQQLVILPMNITQTAKKKPANFYPQLVYNIRKIGGTLVTDNFLSAIYSWKCDVNTVGTAYHRNKEGLIDNYAILYGEKDDVIIPLLLKHQVTQILMFNNYAKCYDMSPQNHKKLYYRLIKRENIPSYLEEIPCTDVNTRLYRVKI